MKKVLFFLGFIFFCAYSQQECLSSEIFGKEFFENVRITETGSGRPVSEKYVLGSGDELSVEVWGNIEQKYSLRIDGEGNVFIPRLGSVGLNGITLAQARVKLADLFNGVYKGVRLDLTLAKVKPVSVLVLGAVEKPGSYTVFPTANIIEVLGMAGGISSKGSYRAVRLTRMGEVEKEFDLYDLFLGREGLPDITFHSSDILYIPLADRFVTIKGSVRRPAIYEMKGDMSLATLVAMAGGFLPDADARRVQVSRTDLSSERRILDVFLAPDLTQTMKRFTLQDGDEVEVFAMSKEVFAKVSVEGFVRNPGTYQWKEGMRLSSILNSEDLLPEALEETAEIVRQTEYGAKEIVPFSPRNLFAGMEDIELKALDRVLIRSKERPIKRAYVYGELLRPGEYVIGAGERLSSLLMRAGGFSDRAWLSGAVFTRISVKQRQKQELEAFVAEKKATIESEYKKAETADEKALIEKSRILLEQLSQTEVSGRIVMQLRSLEEMSNGPEDLLLEDGDTIYIPKQPVTVSIMGEVNHPANIVHSKGAGIDYYVKKAGSYTRNVDKKNIFIVKADGTASIHTSSVDPGDVIIVGFLAKERPGRIFRDVVQMLYQISLAITAF
ncbi:MAG: SLBB domain-containing protein [Candidatus Ratteibacteria bacterium]